MLCFFGFFRSGEIYAPVFDNARYLSFADITVVTDDNGSPKHLSIYLKKSKTDPFGKGTIVCVGEKLCPVAATLSWVVRRGNASGLHRRGTTHSAVIRGRAPRCSSEDPLKYGGHT